MALLHRRTMCFRTTIADLIVGLRSLRTEAPYPDSRYIAKPPAQRPQFERLGPSLFCRLLLPDARISPKVI